LAFKIHPSQFTLYPSPFTLAILPAGSNLTDMQKFEEIRLTLAEHSEQLKVLHVANLWLFGSAARQASDVHDLDFMVEFSQPPGLLNYMDLKFLLEELFGLPVDLHTRRSCPQRFYDRIREDLKQVA
jgi:predicted nucleotidyltransferase